MTSYTSGVESGEVTSLKDFLVICVGGADCQDFSDSFLDKYEKAVTDLDIAQKLAIEEARAEMEADHKKNVDDALRILGEYEETNHRLSAMRGKVIAWVPPTDEHKGLKEFALKQIRISMIPAEIIDMYKRESTAVLDVSEEAVRAYIDRQIKFCEKRVLTAKGEWEAETARAKNHIEYVTQLINSFDNNSEGE